MSVIFPLLRVKATSNVVRRFSSSQVGTIGFIGLGHMGGKMVSNLRRDGKTLHVFDRSEEAQQKVVGDGVTKAPSVTDVAKNCNTIISMLPNDAAIMDVATQVLEHHSPENTVTHISCSTVSPVTSRHLAELYSAKGCAFVAAPVFARPDGIAKRQATWMVSGTEAGRATATKLLTPLGNVVDYGDDVGAANVVKLCGNFLIASSIEAISESMALAEKHGVDREKVMSLLSSTIFDCLIYKGYGERVSKRDHRPGGFSLELGAKDVALVSSAAKQADVPMPFLSLLMDRYTSAKARGRGDWDWSGIGISVAEDAGIDVSEDVARTEKDVKEGNLY